MTDIIIPIKDLSHAKQRLMGVLSPDERAGLVLAMLTDLLTTANEADCGRVLVVASDEAVFDIAHRFHARVVREQEIRGYNAAASLGLAEVGEGNVAVLPGDIPLAAADEINCLIAPADTDSKAIRLAASHDRMGTNGLFLASRNLIRPGFGLNSFARYKRTAQAAGIEPTLIEAPGLSRDIDTPRDLYDLAESVTSGATFSYMRRIKNKLDREDLGKGVA